MENMTLVQALLENYTHQSGIITELQTGETIFSEWCDIVHSLFRTSLALCKYTQLSYAERKDTAECRELYNHLSTISKMIGHINGYPIRSLWESNCDILFMSYARTDPKVDELNILRAGLHSPAADIRKGSFRLFRFRCEKYFARQITIQQLKTADLLEEEQNDLRLIRRLKENMLKRSVKKAEKSSVPSPVSIEFTTFMVRSNVMKCNQNHCITTLQAYVDVMSPAGTISREVFPAGYCKDCQTYFILEQDFRTLRSKGILLCQIVSHEVFLSRKTDNHQNTSLKAESLLHQCGYNVNSADALTAIQRQAILKRVLDNQLYSKMGLLNFLDWLINRNTKATKKDMRVALQKWQADRDFVSNYTADDKGDVQIDKIVFTSYLT